MATIKRHSIESKTVKLHCKVSRQSSKSNIEIVIDKVESKVAQYEPTQLEIDELIAALKDIYDTNIVTYETTDVKHETLNTTWGNLNTK